jgi:hypothetical protein
VPENSTEPDLLDQVWQYPLFAALSGRRSRRFHPATLPTPGYRVERDRGCGARRRGCRIRRPPRFSACGHRRMLNTGFLDKELAAFDPRAAGLLFCVQRTGNDLPKHLSGDRSSGSWRMDALRVPLGFRRVAPDGLEALANPVGIDGVTPRRFAITSTRIRLGPSPRRCGRHASDVDDARPPSGHRLLQQILPTGRLWADAR